MSGLATHLRLTLRLNFRSLMPVIYGYLAPILFLLGFAAVFHDLKNEMGALLTITILGGACFGMPTAMVAERERGVWRRYRLAPMGLAGLVASTMVARLVLVASGAAIQYLLAAAIYQVPWPASPALFAVSFILAAWAFIALGLMIAALADSVPAVQALGQAVFLPMILIGGVGVPLASLPRWAQIIAAFTPGVYSVQALDHCIAGAGDAHLAFLLLVLAVFGASAIGAGAGMFRWDSESRRRLSLGLLLPAAIWCFIGLVGARFITGGGAAPSAGDGDYRQITQAQIDAVRFDNLEDDNSVVTPVVDSLEEVSPPMAQWVHETEPKVAAWRPGQDVDPVQRARNLLGLAALADLGRDAHEGEFAFIVFNQLRRDFDKPALEKILTCIILNPRAAQAPRSATELGLPAGPDESDVRDRSQAYARKLLGRLLGKLS